MAYEVKSNLTFSRIEAAPTVISTLGVLAPGFVAGKHVQLACAAFRLTAAVVSSAPVVITIKKRITSNSATGEQVIGTLSIPGGTAAGVIVYRYFDEDQAPNTFRPGDVCIYEVTTAATTSGAGIPLPEFWEHPQEYKDDAATLEVFA